MTGGWNQVVSDPPDQKISLLIVYLTLVPLEDAKRGGEKTVI
jgi:hypothetical protein